MQQSTNQLSPILFIPHGAGPLPLLGDPSHQDMVKFLQALAPAFGKPSAIVVISAHWEENIVTITSGQTPPLFYDYSGFPDAAYQIQYPAPGDPVLVGKMAQLLHQHGIEARLDSHRGFDHGLFVPLAILFPDADIPCVQLSLLHHLHAEAHIQIGKALRELRQENILIIGSGFSFHNLRAFFSQATNAPDAKNEAFEHWLIDTCTNPMLSTLEREENLIYWEHAPYARYCHPREEHLLPLHVCFGLAQSCAKLVFEAKVAGKKTSAFLW